MAVRTSFGACLLSLALHARAQIRVMAPESLVQQFADTRGRIDGSTATFGAPFYGERILGRLVWGDSPTNRHHCKDDDYTVPALDQVQGKNENEVRLINIIMVRRGDCSFVTKVKVARAKGAHAVIIVDKEESVLSAKDIRKVIVADDGYGSTIDIPSMLIAKEEGKLLIEAAKTSQVIVELAWDVPTNHVVVMDLWMSSASSESLRFLQEFSPKRKALNEKVKFVPHYHVFSMSSAQDANDLCSDGSAEFCAEDPDGSGYITGRMVLDEDVRQLCIHQLTKVKRTDLDSTAGSESEPVATMEYAEKFWNYVEAMLASCPLDAAKEPRFGRACSENLMRKVGIDVDSVNKCMAETRDEKLKAEREYIAWSPRALRINGWRYRGTLDADLVTRAICAGFIKQPPACASLVEPVNHFKRVERPSSGGVNLTMFLTALIGVSLTILGALALYKRSLTRHIHSALREEVMLEVQAQMDSYKQLS
uniref:PA domain-containing protein n=1 Tax=Alexandrium monilatum TaxID=311494 RepID=A0A7S4RYP3_9DINO